MSQCEKILKYLRTHKRGITALIAMEKFGIMRLASRIHDLREMGHKIITSTIEVTNRYGDVCRIACYKLAE